MITSWRAHLHTCKNYFFTVFYSVIFRRILASIFILLGIVQIYSHMHKHPVTIVVAKEKLIPGVEITATMLETRALPMEHLPPTLVTSIAALEHQYVTVPVGVGESISTYQIVNHLNAQDYLPHSINPRIIPLPLSDASLIPALKPGTVVDIARRTTETYSKNKGEILARNAMIVSIYEPHSHLLNHADPLLYIALEQSAAEKLAENPGSISFILH